MQVRGVFKDEHHVTCSNQSAIRGYYICKGGDCNDSWVHMSMGNVWVIFTSAFNTFLIMFLNWISHINSNLFYVLISKN